MSNTKISAGWKDRLPTATVLYALACLTFIQACIPVSCQTSYPSPYIFTTVGAKSVPHFNPNSVAVDTAGNVYFADAKKQVICRLEPSGTANIIAGKSGACGSSDGTGSQARFRYPRGIATDTKGNIYVADTGNCTIRRITPDGVVTTLAGLGGVAGSSDGTDIYARFNCPIGIAVDAPGNIYVADLLNSTIRKVTSNGKVTTIAGQAGIFGGADGRGAVALFNCPIGIAVDSQENVYVADLLNNAIRKITKAGIVTTLAGKMSWSFGYANGIGPMARFRHPSGIVVDRTGNIYVADSGNQIIRRITPDRAVTTLAGLAGQSGFADGTGSAVRFWHPGSLALDRFGNLYVADLINAAIRKGSAAISTNPALTIKRPAGPKISYRE